MMGFFLLLVLAQLSLLVPSLTASPPQVVVKITMAHDLSKSISNQTDFQKRIKDILPPSFPIVVPFLYFPGGVAIFVTNKMVNVTVVESFGIDSFGFRAPCYVCSCCVPKVTATDSLAFLEKQVKAFMKAPAFAQFGISSVDQVNPFGSGAADSSTGNGSTIGGVIVAVCLVTGVAIQITYSYIRSKQEEKLNPQKDEKLNQKMTFATKPGDRSLGEDLEIHLVTVSRPGEESIGNDTGTDKQNIMPSAMGIGQILEEAELEILGQATSQSDHFSQPYPQISSSPKPIPKPTPKPFLPTLFSEEVKIEPKQRTLSKANPLSALSETIETKQSPRGKKITGSIKDDAETKASDKPEDLAAPLFDYDLL